LGIFQSRVTTGSDIIDSPKRKPNEIDGKRKNAVLIEREERARETEAGTG
jgi:hypothetical protein